MGTLNLHLFDAIAWTIIHSFWQGALVFISLLTLFLLNKKWSANTKYIISVLALIVLFASTCASFYYFYFNQNPQISTNGVSDNIVYYYTSITTQDHRQSIVDFINKNTFLISNFWMLGFLFLSIRYLASYAYLYRISKQMPAIDLCEFGIDVEQIKAHFNISKVVEIKSYDQQISPFTLGYFKPIIFMPLTILNGLNPSEIEAIIAHELAHIKRYDFAINIITSMIEVILYYHPVVWWLQKQIEEHRENACDDLAISFKGDKIMYAKALVKLQEKIQKNNPALAMAFTGNNKSIFLNRIKRMFNMPYTQVNIKEKLIASMILFTLAFGITEVYAHKANRSDLSLVNNIKETLFDDVTNEFVSDTMPKSKKKESMTMIKSDGNKDVEVKMEDGKVTYMKIDGKEIPKNEFENHRDVIENMEPMQNNSIRIFGGDMDKMPSFDFDNFHLGRGADLEKLKEQMAIIRLDSMMPFFNFKHDSLFANMDKMQFNLDSLREKFSGKEFKMIFPNGGDMMDLRRFPDIDLKSYGIDMDSPDIQIFGDENGIEGGDNRMTPLREFRGFENNDFGSKNDLESIIGKQLNRDGFLIAGKKNKVELSGKNLKINGEKQPSNIWNKYKELFEIETGMSLNKDTKLVFEIEGKEQKRKVRTF